MVMLTSSVVDHRLGQTKDYEIGICCFSAKDAALRNKNKDLLARNCELTCLPADSCCSVNVTCSGHDIAEIFSFGVKTLIQSIIIMTKFNQG